MPEHKGVMQGVGSKKLPKNCDSQIMDGPNGPTRPTGHFNCLKFKADIACFLSEY
jgi:hypothetical protein